MLAAVHQVVTTGQLDKEVVLALVQAKGLVGARDGRLAQQIPVSHVQTPFDCYKFVPFFFPEPLANIQPVVAQCFVQTRQYGFMLQQVIGVLLRHQCFETDRRQMVVTQMMD
jgi:hypothetical protein